jgi:hypothetical protein
LCELRLQLLHCASREQCVEYTQSFIHYNHDRCGPRESTMRHYPVFHLLLT